MRIYAVITAIFPAFLISCSEKPTANLDYNVKLNCVVPDDPLSELIDSAKIIIDASDFETPIEISLGADSVSSGSMSIDLDIAFGMARRFSAFLKDADGRALFASHVISDVFESRLSTIDMTFNQTGFASGSSVIIFRDQFPWDSQALDSVLIEQGLTLGNGEAGYYVYPSSEMAVMVMRPGIDLVIISNDQPQEFYDNYAASQQRFELFVIEGGTLLWCACDMSWNYGSIAGSGLELPGSVEINYALAPTNIVTNGEFEILRGLPEIITGNYASQEFFTNLQYGAITYLTDADGASTLVGFGIGSGWVIISGQPLEYNYDRRQAFTIGELLPRLIRFLLGVRSGGFLSLLPGMGTHDREKRSDRYSTLFALEGTSRR